MNNTPNTIEVIALKHAQELYSNKYNVRFAGKTEDFAGFDIIVETYKNASPIKLIQVKASKSNGKYSTINKLLNNEKVKFWSHNPIYELWLIEISTNNITIFDNKKLNFLQKN